MRSTRVDKVALIAENISDKLMFFSVRMPCLFCWNRDLIKPCSSSRVYDDGLRRETVIQIITFCVGDKNNSGHIGFLSIDKPPARHEMEITPNRIVSLFDLDRTIL